MFPLARNVTVRNRRNQIGQKCLNCHCPVFSLFYVFGSCCSFYAYFICVDGLNFVGQLFSPNRCPFKHVNRSHSTLNLLAMYAYGLQCSRSILRTNRAKKQCCIRLHYESLIFLLIEPSRLSKKRGREKNKNKKPQWNNGKRKKVRRKKGLCEWDWSINRP